MAKKSFKEKNNYMEEIADIINRPVIVTWSDASTSESNLKNMFSSEESYKRYAEYKSIGGADNLEKFLNDRNIRLDLNAQAKQLERFL